MSMKTALEQLCEHFESELERQRNVAAVLRAQRQAVLDDDLSGLEANTAALETLLREAIGREVTRHALLHQVVSQLDLPPERQTLTDLIAAAPLPWSRRLAEFQWNFRETLREAGRLTRANARIFRRGLTISRALFDVITGGEYAPSCAYTGAGGAAPRTGNPPILVDQRG